MFENKDKDLDGRLSYEEFMGEETRAERLFKLMDKDGDGYVTKHVSFITRFGSLFMFSLEDSCCCMNRHWIMFTLNDH